MALIILPPCPRLIMGCQLAKERRRPRLIRDAASPLPELLGESTAVVTTRWSGTRRRRLCC
jgi:hypothetical protein